MVKKIKVLLTGIAIILAMALVYGILFYWDSDVFGGFSIKEITKHENAFRDSNHSLITGATIYQNGDYKGIRWISMPVTYTFENIEICGDFQTRRILEAFKEIENSTDGVVKFAESKNGLLKIFCSKNFPAEKGYVTSAETTYSLAGNIVTNASITFYNTLPGKYNGGCINYPNVEIHEILHTFGYEHSEDTNSIMYPETTKCYIKIDKKIIDELKLAYS